MAAPASSGNLLEKCGCFGWEWTQDLQDGERTSTLPYKLTKAGLDDNICEFAKKMFGFVLAIAAISSIALGVLMFTSYGDMISPLLEPAINALGGAHVFGALLAVGGFFLGIGSMKLMRCCSAPPKIERFNRDDAV